MFFVRSPYKEFLKLVLYSLPPNSELDRSLWLSELRTCNYDSSSQNNLIHVIISQFSSLSDDKSQTLHTRDLFIAS